MVLANRAGIAVEAAAHSADHPAHHYGHMAGSASAHHTGCSFESLSRCTILSLQQAVEQLHELHEQEVAALRQEIQTLRAESMSQISKEETHGGCALPPKEHRPPPMVDLCDCDEPRQPVIDVDDLVCHPGAIPDVEPPPRPPPTRKNAHKSGTSKRFEKDGVRTDSGLTKYTKDREEIARLSEQIAGVDHENSHSLLPRRRFPQMTKKWNEMPMLQSWLQTARWIYNSLCFEMAVCFFIALNVVTLGLVADAVVTDHSHSFEVFLVLAEVILSIIFVFEVLGRFLSFGWRAFYPSTLDSVMNLIDAVVVLLCNVIIVWIMPASYMAKDGKVVRLLMNFRFLRLMRFYRVARELDVFRDIASIYRGIAGSMVAFIWAVVVLFTVTVVFSIFGVIAISDDLHQMVEHAEDPTEHHELEELHKHFGNLQSAIFTMAEILTVEGFVPHFIRPMWKYFPRSPIFFYSYLALMDLLFLNLVTAMVVDNAIANSKLDEERNQARLEEEKKREMAELTALFNQMDENGDGTISWEEFKEAFKNQKVAQAWQLLDFQPEDAKEVFYLLEGGRGDIPIEDFFDGLRHMRGNATSKDLFRLQRTVEDLVHGLEGKVLS